MCDVCKANGVDPSVKNGTKGSKKAKLYKVYQNSVANVTLCYLHDIELFNLGEIRFLQKYIKYATTLVTKSVKNEDSFF